MEQMLRISLFILLAYGSYFLLLKKSNHYKARRGFMITLFLGAALVPLGSFLVWVSEIPSYVIPEALTLIGSNAETLGGNGEKTSFSLMEGITFLLPIIYLLGVAYGATRFLIQVNRLRICFAQSRDQGRYRMLFNSKLAFSSFNTIFIGEALLEHEDDLEMIIDHEQKHVLLGHSFDLLLLSIFSILFWFLPIWKSVRKELSLIHELQVDEAIIEKYDRVNYAQLLIKRSTGSLGLPVHCFGQLLTEKRLQAMITKRNKPLNSKRLILNFLPLLMLWAIIACSQEPIPEAAQGSELKAQLEKKNGEEVYNVVEKMPVFKECDDPSKSTLEIKNCSQKMMLELIYKNVVYPKSAQKEDKEGTVVCSFIIDKKGHARDPKLVKSVDADLDQAAMDAIQKVVAAGEIWNPGIEKGKAVSVEFKVPIKFKLSPAETKEKE